MEFKLAAATLLLLLVIGTSDQVQGKLFSKHDAETGPVRFFRQTTERGAPVRPRYVEDDLTHWATNNIDFARSSVVAEGSPLTFKVISEELPGFSECRWTTPTGLEWRVSAEGVVDSEGNPVDGVSSVEDNYYTTCGITIASADFAQHWGDWMVLLHFDKTEDLPEFDVNGYITTEDSVTTNLRLPEDVLPAGYIIMLEPSLNVTDLHLIQFDGNVAIYVNVLNDKPCVRIHADEIALKDLAVSEVFGTVSQLRTVSAVGFDYQRTFLDVCIQEGFKAGSQYMLEIAYFVNSDRPGYYQYGFYPINCNYGDESICWYTQGEATNARNTFPCLDEPAMKTTHSVVIGRDKDTYAQSNMPLILSEPSPDNENIIYDFFEVSPDMSSYLLAVAITNYVPTVSDVEAKVPHTIWAPAEETAAGYADYSAEIGPRIVNFYEAYFETDYPLPKMDYTNQIDYYGAMENWGLILFDPDVLLVNPSSVGDFTNTDRWWVSSVVAHELAHQWFGNIVTLGWWGQMWLNEGFATYVSYLGAQEVDPFNQPWSRMIVDETFYVMSYDSDVTYHWPMTDEVTDRDDIERKFGMFTYNKGGSVIRMMESVLTREVLTRGLIEYLHTFSYSSTTEDDLFLYLDEAGRSAGSWPGTYPKDVSFGEVMKLWTNQAGYPVVTVSKACENGCQLYLSQNWFVTEGITNGEERLFPVPISMKTVGSDTNWEDASPSLWLLDSSETVVALEDDVDESSLVLVNLLATGYYRVNYDDNTWTLIGDTLKQDPELIHAFNRAKIVCDLEALSAAGLVSQDIYSYVLDGYEDSDFGVQYAMNECSNGFKNSEKLMKVKGRF